MVSGVCLLGSAPGETGQAPKPGVSAFSRHLLGEAEVAGGTRGLTKGTREGANKNTGSCYYYLL